MSLKIYYLVLILYLILEKRPNFRLSLKKLHSSPNRAPIHYKISQMRIFIILIFISLSSFAQPVVDDVFGWNWVKLKGEFDDDPSTATGNLIGVLEFHYRLQNNVSEMKSVMIRPMMGYNLDDNSTLWAGYAYVEVKTDDGYRRENRLFQMITYNSSKAKPIVFLGRTGIEERFFENQSPVNLRFRQMLGISLKLFKIKESQVKGYFTNETFMSYQSRQFGFDQNRVLLGIGVDTSIGNTPVKFKAGYLNIQTGTGQMSHGFSVGASIYLNRKK